jgi:uncharacterized protein (TIGR04255 family)
MVRSNGVTAEEREPKAVIYPGAPLRAVGIEVGFPALLDALARFGAFQRRNGKTFTYLFETSGADYERIRLPEGREFEQPRSAVLISSDRSRAVSVSTDQLAAITYPYETGFGGFTEWALPTLREGLRDLEVECISRVGYRYENRIPLPDEGLDLSSLFQISLSPPREARRTTAHVHMQWHQHWDGGWVEVRLDACSGLGPEIRLDITAHCLVPGEPADAISTVVAKAHRWARLTFEDLITPSFRDRLQGGN